MGSEYNYKSDECSVVILGIKIWEKCRRIGEIPLRFFFIYDINKLYKETQEFYSYTYNYIFMRIDADYKYLFTDIALKTKKI